jgi:hypothetical protein
VSLVEHCAKFRRTVMSLSSRYRNPTRSRLAARNEPTKKPIRKLTKRRDVHEGASTSHERRAIPEQNIKVKYGGTVVGIELISVVTRHELQLREDII